MSERIQTLGKHAYAIPFVIALVVFCVLGTAIAPLLRMAPQEMPVAIVNLDEGAQLPTGDTLVSTTHNYMGIICTYDENYGGMRIYDYEDTMSELIIPAEINGEPVAYITGLGGNTNIRSVVFEGIKIIGAAAFPAGAQY